MEDKITIRAGRSSDEPSVREFTSHTFEWGDYVGDAYPEWIAGMEKGDGFIYVASDDTTGKVVAIHHLRYLSPEEAWFEGIRVHPDFRRSGIGRKLTLTAIENAKARGIKICRAAIDADNFRSQGLARGVGFEPVVPIVQFESDLQNPALSPATDNTCEDYAVRGAEPKDAYSIYAQLSKEMSYVGGDYTWWRVTPENLIRVLADQKFRVAVDKCKRIVAGAVVSDTYVDKESPNPIFYGELASPFGEHDGLMAIICEYASNAAKEASEKGLPGKLCVSCEGRSPVTEMLPHHDFKERFFEGRRDEMWLWELLLAD